MKKMVIKLKESDLVKIVKEVLNESYGKKITRKNSISNKKFRNIVKENTENMDNNKPMNSEMMVDYRATLNALREKVKAGAKVVIEVEDNEFKEVFKMPFVNLVTFVGGGKIVLPQDESLELLRDQIIVDGEKLEIHYRPKPKPREDTRTPEEKEKARQEYMDRYGPGGGVDTWAGRYTGD